jgi:hypothetical protein
VELVRRGWTAVEQRARSPIPLPGRGTSGDRGWDAQTRTSAPTGNAAAVLDAAARSAGISVAAARGIAERAHQGRLDANGEPHIAQVGRVAAGVPLFARAVGWLHDVLDCPGVDESVLVAAGASPDQCVALRLLAGGEAERSCDLYLENVRVIALWPGASGRIAHAVKRADLLDHVLHRMARSDVWSPPYGAALVTLMIASAGSAVTASDGRDGWGSRKMLGPHRRTGSKPDAPVVHREGPLR